MLTRVLDVVVGPSPVGRPEVVEPANRLHLRRPLVTHPYRLDPIADQIADKVCATMDTNYPGGKRSSRVKDLVDLVVLAHTQSLDLAELRQAIEAKRLIGKSSRSSASTSRSTGPAPTPRPRKVSRRPSPSRLRRALISSPPSSTRHSTRARTPPSGTPPSWPGLRPRAAPTRPQPTRERRLRRSARVGPSLYDI